MTSLAQFLLLRGWKHTFAEGGRSRQPHAASGRNLEGGWLAIVAKRGKAILFVKKHIFSHVLKGASQSERDQKREAEGAPARVMATASKEVNVDLSPPRVML